MHVYQSASGDWIMFDGTTKHRYATQQEAQAGVSKTTFVDGLRRVATALAAAANDADDLTSIYFDRGYNSGGANELLDGETSLPATTITNLITLYQAYAAFLNNGEVSAADRDSVLNVARNDL